MYQADAAAPLTDLSEVPAHNLAAQAVAMVLPGAGQNMQAPRH